MCKGFCLHCESIQETYTSLRSCYETVRGIQFEYTEKVARCITCRSEVYSPEINDENCKARIKAFYEAQGGDAK